MEKDKTPTVKQALTLADITDEQAIQVARLAFGDAKESDIGLFGVSRTDMRIEVSFVAYAGKGDSESMIAVITKPLNVYLKMVDGDAATLCGVSGQRAIHRLLTEWGAE